LTGSAALLVRKLLTALLLPPTGPLLVALFGYLLTRKRHPRAGRVLIWAGLLSLFLLSLPLVSWRLQGALQNSPPLDYGIARQAQAIVILGGGSRRDALEYGGDTLSAFSLERARYGAWVARRTELPVLVSGGVVFNGAPEATLMRNALQDELGVKVRWTEETSRNTHENAEHSAALLRAEGIEKIILVTHGFHMRRAQAEFSAAGFEVIAAPTRIHNPEAEMGPWILWLLPDAGALRDSSYALREGLGDLARRMGL
jgi:uncharacterized SAM-binding protein YcdF (DUF218 family)